MADESRIDVDPPDTAGRRRRRRIGCYGLATTATHVLLVRIAEGYPGADRWTLPGGGLDFGEAPLDCLVREVREETGLAADVGEHLLHDSHVVAVDGRDEDLHLLRFVWRVEVDVTVEPSTLEVGGSTELARWVPLDEVEGMPLLSLATAALAAAGLPNPSPDRRGGAV